MKDILTTFQKELLDVAGLADTTVATYVSSVIEFLEFVATTCKIDPFDAAGHHILDWFSSIKHGISPSRLRQHQFALKKFYAFLKKRSLIEHNPTSALTRVGSKNGGKNTAVSAKTVFSLLDAIEQTSWLGKRNHLIISMLWCLGLRVNELTGLTVGSFEPNHDPRNRIGLLRIKGKNKKQRALFVVDALYDQLCVYLAHHQTPTGCNQPLFPVGKGKSISANRIQKFVKEYARKAGVEEHVTPHRLRHSFATEMYRHTVPVSAIQAMLGHTRKAETAVYVHVPEHMKRQALAEVSIRGGELCR
jgi:site-specific recombinase XerD